MTITMRVAAVFAGFLLDLWLGDPEWLYHPVQAIGALISRLETWLRPRFKKSAHGELAAGTVLTAVTIAVTGVVSAVLLYLASRIHPAVRFVLASLMCWQILAVRSLKRESMKVYDALQDGDVEAARDAVSRIVGRDTAGLTKAGIVKAAVETVAENTSDGIIAPLCYLFVGGPVLGFMYKAVNTMDSMIGYRNERYLYFGRPAARLDDVVNWLPARIAAVLLIVSAPLCGLNGGEALRIWKRDRRCHKSPNSAQGEAACAGALGIQLAGDAVYFGTLCKKPTIGDPVREVETEDIRRVNKLSYASAWIGVLIGIGGAVWYAGMGAIFTGR